MLMQFSEIDKMYVSKITETRSAKLGRVAC